MATTTKKTSTAKKPATEKAAPVKKPVAAKKPAEKKPTAKKAVAAKPAAKKPATKAAAAKAASAKAAPAKKTATPKPAAKPAVAKKSAAPKPAPEVDHGIKVLNLFDAYQQDKLPRDQGYIVSSFFKETSAYSVYEIVSYSGVKEIAYLGNGLQFTSNSKKIHILIEPPSYAEKHVDPVHRKAGENIPYRESELEIIKAIDQTRIMIAKEPLEVPSSFTILEPSGINFSVVFYNRPDIYESLAAFFTISMNRDRRIAQRDAYKAAQKIVQIVENVMSFKSDFM
jgi:hypothetical protein